VFGWWQSGHYSERRLHYFGSRSAEVFTSSSLIRISVVDGYIDPHGRPRGYKQRNARGKMMIRPMVPSLRFAPTIWELTLGFWHLVLGIVVATGIAAVCEWRILKKRRGEHAAIGLATGRD
jgi:hypothetical protein